MGNVNRSRQTGAAFRPVVCESLEPRLLMSGNVTVVVQDGVLEVQGDRFANQITIDQTGLAAGQFHVIAADSDTTINGQSQGQIFDGVSDLDVHMGHGADKLTLKDLNIQSTASTVAFKMGYGSDTLVFDNDTFYCRVIGSLGQGNDRVWVGDDTKFQTAAAPDPNGFQTYHTASVKLLSPTYKIYGGGGHDKLVLDTIYPKALIKTNRGVFRNFSGWKLDPALLTPVTIGDEAQGGSGGSGSAAKLASGHIKIDPTWTTQQQLAADNSNFAFDLYHQLQAVGGNIFFSPLSISSAMAMLYAGANGETADQIAKTMSFLLPKSDFSSAFGTLLNKLAATSGDNSTLDIANSMWGQQDFAFLDSYIKTLQKDFQSELHKVDFADDPDTQRATINQWVSDHTDQMIKDLLPPGSITPDTRLVLANAIFFNAQWEYNFDAAKTVQQAFHLPGSDVNVSMMKQSEDYQYYDGGNFQAVEIPYVGNKSMIVLLPTASSFNKFDSSLTAAEVQTIEDEMSTRTVNLSLPKFTYEQSTSLSDTLTKMGIKDAFVWHKADLSGIDGGSDLFVSDVIHKAKIEVSEKGTKASAATAITTVTALCVVERFQPPPPVTVTVDHPFIYIIKDNTTNSTLFVGRVSDAAAFA